MRRKGEEPNRKRWERRCVEVQQEGKGRERRKKRRKNQQFSGLLKAHEFSNELQEVGVSPTLVILLWVQPC